MVQSPTAVFPYNIIVAQVNPTMLFDMNSEGTIIAETQSYADWPFVAPARTPVREEVIIRGSSTGGRKLAVEGTSDAYEPPDLHIPPK